MSGLTEDATELLQQLLRFDTVNPPGNERAAQEHLAALLSEAGFACELLGAEPERPNLVARLESPGRRGSASSASTRPVSTPSASTSRASTPSASTRPASTRPAHDGLGSPGPTLCYLGHVDTVLADAQEWTHDPWSGDVEDGFVWGRGALDMKSQVAAEIAAALSLAREGWRPARGALQIVAVVDEETGGSLGAEWITRTHPEKVRCDLLVNEGGGAVFEYGGRRLYGVCCAEKGVFRFTLSTEGVAGHASMPKMGDNALLKMAPLLDRLAARQPAYALTAEPEAFLRGLGEDPADVAGALERMAAADERLLAVFEPMFGVTFTPTRISASEKINVIPSRAELKVDCRVPPGLGEAEVLRGIEEVLGTHPPTEHPPTEDKGKGSAPEGLRRLGRAGRESIIRRVRFTERVIGNRSPIDSPLMRTISQWVAEHDPGAEVVPVILPGFTDSRHFRAAFPECVAYGFFPHRHQSLFETMPLIHGADERIDVRDLGFAAEFYRDLALRILG